MAHVERQIATKPRPASLHAVVWIGLILGSITGCHTSGLYQATALPPQYMAPAPEGPTQIDFTQLASAQSTSDVLYPGDVIKITITTGLENDEPIASSMRIAPDGTIDVPLVGPVPIGGLSISQAETRIRDESIRRGTFVRPNVALMLDKRKTNRITVVGAVEQPGTYELPRPNADVLTAILEAGGLSDQAGSIVEIRQPELSQAVAAHPPGTTTRWASYRHDDPTAPRTIQLDLNQLSDQHQPGMFLEDGATVMVMQQPKRFIHVIGLVRRADQFEMPEGQDIRLLDAIALAGGRTLEIADKVRILRQVPGRAEPVVIESSVTKAKRDGSANIRLAPGDVVSVEETALTFMVGTIRDFVRFGFSSALPLF